MNFQRIIICLFAMVLFAACERENFSPEGDLDQQMQPNTSNSRLLNLVNGLRRQGCYCGPQYMPPVSPLSINNKLNEAALRHAMDMDYNDFFDHVGSDGSEVSDRVTDSGYAWSTVGENIAWGYEDIESVFFGWRDSPGHCRNLMNPYFQHMGTARSGEYWVQDLARPGVGN